MVFHVPMAAVVAGVQLAMGIFSRLRAVELGVEVISRKFRAFGGVRGCDWLDLRGEWAVEAGS